MTRTVKTPIGTKQNPLRSREIMYSERNCNGKLSEISALEISQM